jgi:hypothetical protein
MDTPFTIIARYLSVLVPGVKDIVMIECDFSRSRGKTKKRDSRLHRFANSFHSRRFRE